MIPTHDSVRQRLGLRFGDCSKFGWRIRLNNRFGYCDPDAWYEAVVDGLVTPDTTWLDVGGGKSILPFNKELAAALARRCKFLAAVDPSPTVQQNRLAHEVSQCMMEDYTADRLFDLVTMRMVAEHIEQPDRVVVHLATLVKPGGRVVLITPNKWSPATIASALIPSRLHPAITRFLWGTKDEDVFPAVYRMNTRRTLRTLFERHGFREAGFHYCPNCTTFQRFRWLCIAERIAWRMLYRLGLSYPENNLHGVYELAGLHSTTPAMIVSKASTSQPRSVLSLAGEAPVDE
jgi:2-polyprenyl-3-methyl-5-hydroxy-6-metoxy-1,4-benzoquinol methylase